MGIKKLFIFCSSLLIMLTAGACSSTNWVVINEQAKDVNDYELINTRYYLDSNNGIIPNHPLIHFELKAVDTFRYAKRVKTERYIQRYRPRLDFLLLGAAGAGLSYYAAFSDQLVKQPSDLQRYSLIGAGTLLTGLSFLNMKQVGEPTKTGETRLLRKTGSVLDVDTTVVRPYNTEAPSIKILYKEQELANHPEWSFTDGSITVNLAQEIDAGAFDENPDEFIRVEARFDTLTHVREVPVSSIFEQFVVVNTQITALRNAPEANPANVLTDLAEGSQLKLVSKEGDYYKVLYGISETWIAARDVNTIWRPSEFASELSVIAIPNVPFGSVDIERNIPVLGLGSVNSSAFILSNNQFEGDISERIYGQRDARLIQEYLIQGLGVRSPRVIKAMNVHSDNMTNRAYARLVSTMGEEKQNLYVYINGYAEIKNDKVLLVGSALNDDNELRYIDLKKLFTALSKLNTESIIVVADLDFLNGSDTAAPLQKLASVITDENPSSAVFFGAKAGQRSGIYSSQTGIQNRHSIFTYFFADALKQKNTSMQQIYNHLLRNVSFTSRSLYDRPQNPLFYGNQSLQILN